RGRPAGAARRRVRDRGAAGRDVGGDERLVERGVGGRQRRAGRRVRLQGDRADVLRVPDPVPDVRADLVAVRPDLVLRGGERDEERARQDLPAGGGERVAGDDRLVGVGRGGRDEHRDRVEDRDGGGRVRQRGPRAAVQDG